MLKEETWKLQNLNAPNAESKSKIGYVVLQRARGQPFAQYSWQRIVSLAIIPVPPFILQAPITPVCSGRDFEVIEENPLWGLYKLENFVAMLSAGLSFLRDTELLNTHSKEEKP